MPRVDLADERGEDLFPPSPYARCRRCGRTYETHRYQRPAGCPAFVRWWKFWVRRIA